MTSTRRPPARPAIRRVTSLLAAGLFTLGATGCGVADLLQDEEDSVGGWQEQADAIDGIVNHRQTRPELLEPDHTEDPVSYEVLPPTGGPHHPAWQNCQGEVYPEPIGNEHAVHSMEHGAVWITYRPDLPPEQVTALAERVRGTDKLFLSPFPELDAPVSLQAWGYQLKVDDADDPRIDAFIRALRVNASLEGPTAPCTGGVADTRTS